MRASRTRPATCAVGPGGAPGGARGRASGAVRTVTEVIHGTPPDGVRISPTLG
ncbi:hypothetical protein KPATCC21470_6270 [Kitasatospora purpeofusca]